MRDEIDVAPAVEAKVGPPAEIVLATCGTRGDLQPFLALALGLRGRGWSVTLLVPAYHAPTVRLAGLRCVSFGEPEDQRLLGSRAMWDERHGLGVFWSTLAPHLEVFRRFLGDELPPQRPCVLITHPMLVPAAALGRSLRPKLRIFAACLAPSNLCSAHDLLTIGSRRLPRMFPAWLRRALWRAVFALWIDPVTLPQLNALREKLQLPPVQHFFPHIFSVPDRVLGFFPDWFAAPQRDWPARFTQCGFPPEAVSPAPLSPELQEFLAAGAPPVAFTAGTGQEHAERFFQVALEVLRRSGRRGLFITPYPAQLPPVLPPCVQWVDRASFQLLLPQVTALVHHGGIGTLRAALAAGTPQLVVPFAYDQFDNALRARRLGVGDSLPARRLSVRALEFRLRRLLAADEVQRACRQLGARLAGAESPDSLYAKLEQLIRETDAPVAAELAPKRS